MIEAVTQERAHPTDRATEQSRGNVSAQILTAAATAGRARGVAVDAALSAVGIESQMLSDPEARVPIELEEAFWDELTERAGDPCFGLRAQLYIPEGTIDLADREVRSSSTLAEALDKLAGYPRPLRDLSELTVEQVGDEARVIHRYRKDVPGPSWQAADYSIGGLYVAIQRLVKRELRPRRILIAHAAPTSSNAYATFFGVLPLFGGKTNEIVFDAEYLSAPVVTADPQRKEVLHGYAKTPLEQFEAGEQLTQRIRMMIAESLETNDVRVQHIARRLGIGTRALQRQLSALRTSHRQLLDETRNTMALELLSAERQISIAEVAQRLGYSEASAFHRAFQRWQALTPDQFRRQTG